MKYRPKCEDGKHEKSKNKKRAPGHSREKKYYDCVKFCNLSLLQNCGVVGNY